MSIYIDLQRITNKYKQKNNVNKNNINKINVNKIKSKEGDKS